MALGMYGDGLKSLTDLRFAVSNWARVALYVSHV